MFRIEGRGKNRADLDMDRGLFIPDVRGQIVAVEARSLKVMGRHIKNVVELLVNPTQTTRLADVNIPI